jgi:peptide/nickel transport system ATP-binding protein
MLNIRNLTVTFPSSRKRKEVKALDDFSISLKAAESISIIGESGSGKTTLLRCISGHVAPSAGSIELFGRDLTSASGRDLVALRRRCGVVSQDPYGSLPPTLTVLEAVMEPWLLVKGRDDRKAGERKARALLDELGIGQETVLTSRVRLSLSGGQRQRVAIARALVLDPELLLCDEPTSMQDASTRGEILRILQRRQEAGMSMIFVTHDLFLARKAARRGLVLHRGKIVEEGLCRNFLASPEHPYTKALVAALPRLSSSGAPS